MSGERPAAIVTGASRGIGAACARRLAEAGYPVVVNYHAEAARADEVARAIRDAGGRSTAIQADVRDSAAVGRMVAGAVEAYGGVEVLVNGAIADVALKPFAELRWEEFQTLLDVQVRGAVQCCQAVLPVMERSGRGSIINIVSTFVLGAPPARNAAYVTAKAALLGLSRALAAEYTGRGIRVNAVSPAPTETDLLAVPPRVREMMAAQHPMKRLGKPDDCARAVAFLAGDGAAYISGANLVVAGGQVMW